MYNRDEAKKDKVIGVATWFKEEGDEEPFCRRLRGEISLPKNLKPTVMLPCFNMDVCIYIFRLDVCSHGSCLVLCHIPALRGCRFHP